MTAERVVLVTGASSGIGLETARLLSRENLRVLGTKLTHEIVEEVGFEVLDLDVNSDESVATCVNAVLDRAGRLDVLVNNAGIGLVGMVEETLLAECKAMFETNYFGTVRMIRAVLPVMREQGEGLIINTSSVAGHIGVPYEAHYCACKLAIDSLTRALRYEVASFGIDVCVVAPGYVRTSFYDVLREAEGQLDAYDGVRERAIESFEESARQGNEAPAIAREVVKIVKTKSPHLRYWAGKDARLYGRFHKLIPGFLMDRIMRKKFAPRR